MVKIAAFIEFDKKITKKILYQKRIVKKNFGNQIYLNHPVHLTLFVIKIKKISELKEIYKKQEKNLNKPFFITVTSSDIFINDPLTEGHTIFYRIKKNKKIREVQLKHIKKINENIQVLKNETELFKISVLKKNYERYGFPFVGKIWIPHITIASLKNIEPNHRFLNKFLKSKLDLKCLVSAIRFYKISKNKHDFLFSVKDI
jgi:2'-5' RNA ligase